MRYSIDPKGTAKQRHFQHSLIVRETRFRIGGGDGIPAIQALYARLATDPARNELVIDDILRALEDGRSPLVLTERRDHLDYLAERPSKMARNVVVLRGGMGTKQRRAVLEQLAAIPNNQERLLLATGRFAGEGFDTNRSRLRQ